MRVVSLVLLSFAPIAAADPVVEGLLNRRVPELAGSIGFEDLSPKSAGGAFSLGHRDGKVIVRGDSTNSRAAGLHWYLKRHCGMHFSWSGDQTAVPEMLPLPDEPPRESPWRWRGAHNHCVFSYTMAFWDWERWEREIDLLALNGYNQAYLLTGHEKVWRNTLKRLGFTDEKIATWLPSTSHVSWWHFDNLQGEGGPLTEHEIENEAKLARRVADRMREFGIEPIACGFYGMVPDFFAERFPSAGILPQGGWVGGYQRPPMLDPTDPLFARVAAIYYEELAGVLGPVRQFGGDPFHEGGRAGDLDLAQAFKAVQDAMRKDNPEAVWVMFGWQSNPRQEALALLSPEHVLVQQTSIHPGTAVPVSGAYRDLGGRIPWTWQIIDNFGGNHGLFGNFDTLASMPSRFLGGEKMPGRFSGIGHSPEGIGTNPLQAALFNDMLWRSGDVSVPDWLDAEITARYGKSSGSARGAWSLLARSSYRCPISQEGISDLVFGARPKPDVIRARTWSGNAPYWCELDVVEAWRLLLDAAPELSGNVNFRHDLIDVTRHVMNFHSLRVQREMMAAFDSRDRSAFESAAADLLVLFDELDALLASGGGDWMLGTWLEAAKAKGADDESRARIERNARNLISLWSGKNDSLDDYSSRSWAGLVGGYYKARWSRYIEDLRNGWEKPGVPGFSGSDIEQAFLNDRKVHATKPAGDTAEISRAIYRRISKTVRATASLRWSVPQNVAGEIVLRYDVSERIEPGKPMLVSLSRQYGDAECGLVRLVFRSGGKVLAESDFESLLGPASAWRKFNGLPESAAPVILEITLRSPGGHALANGPIHLGFYHDASERDYLGSFEYKTQGSTWARVFERDGSVKLFRDGADAGWRGYTWKFDDGEARLFKTDGTLFERHLLSGPDTLLFLHESHFGPATRVKP